MIKEIAYIGYLLLVYKHEFIKLLYAILQEQNKSIRSFCKEKNIPYMTFKDWLINEEKITGTGKTTALSPYFEKLMVLLLVMLSASGLPFGKQLIQDLVQKGIESGCIQVNPKVKFTDNRPGRYYSYIIYIFLL